MGLPQLEHRMSFDEFIEWTQTFEGQQGKYEWYKGEIFDVHAMAGARSDHNRIAGNVFAALHTHLAGTRCEAFVADMRLRVEADDVSYFPDVMVTCSEADRSRDLVKTDAVLVVEVISPSTEAYDRGKKFASYRKLVSLQELVFIDPEGRRIDHFRRVDATIGAADAAPDTWVVLPADGPLTLSAVELSLTRDQVFAGVTSATTVEPVSP